MRQIAQPFPERVWVVPGNGATTGPLVFFHKPDEALLDLLKVFDREAPREYVRTEVSQSLNPLGVGDLEDDPKNHDD